MENSEMKQFGICTHHCDLENLISEGINFMIIPQLIIKNNLNYGKDVSHLFMSRALNYQHLYFKVREWRDEKNF